MGSISRSEVTCQKSKGFSLLELLIYIALLLVVLTVIVPTFISFSQGRGRTISRSEVDSVLRFATEKISQDIKSASFITTPASAAATSSVLAMTVSGSSVTYDLIDNKLRRQAGVAQPEIISSDSVAVSNLVFTRIENINTVLAKKSVSIEIDVTASYNSTSPEWQYSANKKTTVSLR